MIDVKSEIVNKRIKLVDLVKKLEEKNRKKICYASFATRLTNGNLRLSEAEEILELIGSRLVVVDKGKKDIFLNKNA